MSSYDEHLISQAGGDGDELAKIEARRRAYMRGDTSQQTIFEIVEDGAHLLALVREQATKIERVRELHVREVIAVHESYGAEAWCPKCRVHWPCEDYAAINATGSKP